VNTETLGLHIEKHPALLVYFTSPQCVACKSLRPKVEQMAELHFPEMKYLLVDASQNPSMTSDAGVYSAPTLVVYFEGKEYIRESKYISVEQLKEKIERYYNLMFG